MILGRIYGKTTTTQFNFKLDNDAKKFDFVQAYHKDYEYVLAQITEIEHGEDKIARCQVIGYVDDGVKPVRVPLDTGSEVLAAEDSFVQKVVQLKDSEGALLGMLDGHNIQVRIDLPTLLTKHVSVIAKSGAGKSYTVGVLLEEIMERNIPLVVIDPHGEYTSMREPNEEEEAKELVKFGLKSGACKIEEFRPSQGAWRTLRLPITFSFQELMHLLPKLSSNQQAVLYSAVKHGGDSFPGLLMALEAEESNAKYSVINLVEQLRATGVFSTTPTPYTDLIKPGTASIINLKGTPPELQELIVYKLCRDLFEQRKTNALPPFFLVLEEAHNYCPERSFGETAASKTIRTIASEGRKFGLGLCVVSQRPARVDKSVLSQCTTNIILKVTNPNDIRALTSSVEGMTSYAESEIANLPIGTALITGIADIPLLVKVRPRKTKHGGTAIDVLNVPLPNDTPEEMLTVIYPPTSLKDRTIMANPGTTFSTKLIPVLVAECGSPSCTLIYDLASNQILTELDQVEGKRLPELHKLSKQQVQTLQQAFQIAKGNPEFPILRTTLSNEDITILIREGYLTDNGQYFNLASDVLFQPIQTLNQNVKVEYAEVTGAEKVKQDVNAEEAAQTIGRFAKVKKTREAYLIQHTSS
ncbi:MAG: ATP-binding protein [Candidatus Woesearchaeota archaeon]